MIRCDGTYHGNIRTCNDNLQSWSCHFFVFKTELKIIYNVILLSKFVSCRGSENPSWNVKLPGQHENYLSITEKAIA